MPRQPFRQRDFHGKQIFPRGHGLNIDRNFNSIRPSPNPEKIHLPTAFDSMTFIFIFTCTRENCQPWKVIFGHGETSRLIPRFFPLFLSFSVFGESFFFLSLVFFFFFFYKAFISWFFPGNGKEKQQKFEMFCFWKWRGDVEK